MYTAFGSLADNQICGLDEDGSGTYTAEGINALCDTLKGNNTLTSLDLSGNFLCGLTTGEFTTGEFGELIGSVIGTYTTVGINALCDALKGNSTLTSLKYAQANSKLSLKR